MRLLEPDEAWARVADLLVPLPDETTPLEQAAGRYLSAGVNAPHDLPPFDSSAMDGYALRAADLAEATDDAPVWLDVPEVVYAGDVPAGDLTSGRAMKIMTGAPVPDGSDSVVRLEDGRLRDGRVAIASPVPEGRHVRTRGEDIAAGEELAAAGTELTTQVIGLLAAAGVSTVQVPRQPQVGIAATGSELLEIGQPRSGAAIHDANRPVLRGLLSGAPVELTDLGIIADTRLAVRDLVASAADLDVLIISGGVSVGDRDHVRPVLKELGADTVFWRVRIKPGKPLLVARLGDLWIVGLPGNPISAVTGYVTTARPLIAGLCGMPSPRPKTSHAVLYGEAAGDADRHRLLTARTWIGDDGVRRVRATSRQGSAMMRTLADSNAFIHVPPGEARSEGDVVTVYDLPEQYV